MLHRSCSVSSRAALGAARLEFAKKAAADNLQERLVTLCRHRGFIFPGSSSTAAWPTASTTARSVRPALL